MSKPQIADNKMFNLPLALAALSTAVLMSCFEGCKQLVDPDITIWVSHSITIIFTTVISVLITYFALKKYGSLRQQLENKIVRLNTELENSNRELEAFNFTVAHDLRQPLNLLSSHCQLIQKMFGDQLPEECRGYLLDAYHTTLRMNSLVEALLNFSRTGQASPQREQLDLSQLAHEAARTRQQAEPGRHVDFRIADGIVGTGDMNLIRIVLDNLIGNAWKYTVMREKAVIEFGVRDVGGVPSYFVRDNGAGFDMADANKIFAPFRRLPGTESYDGFGIGLATVERIIRRHGGKVWAEGEPGKGACIYFTLP
jgi:light-regulated signal transduction histidine kinase (bacteriophytochrome)